MKAQTTAETQTSDRWSEEDQKGFLRDQEEAQSVAWSRYGDKAPNTPTVEQYQLLLDKSDKEVHDWIDAHNVKAGLLWDEKRKVEVLAKRLAVSIIVMALAVAANFYPRPEKDCPGCIRAHVADIPAVVFNSSDTKPDADVRVIGTIKAYVDTNGVFRSADDGEPMEVMEWKPMD